MKCACGLWNVGVGGENGWVGDWGVCIYGFAYGVCVPPGGGRGRRIPSGLRIAVRWALGARRGGSVVRGEVCEVV